MKDIKEGIIIRTRYNIVTDKTKSPRYAYQYYICKNDEFEIIIEGEDISWKFKGIHFISKGNTYFHHTTKGSPSGFEIFDDWYEIVNELPKNLIQ